MKRMIMIGILVLAVFLTGCIDATVYSDVRSDGVVDIQFDFEGDDFLLNMIENSFLENPDESDFEMVRGDGIVTITGEMNEDYYTFEESGNWFNHRYTYTQKTVFGDLDEEQVEMITTKQFVNVPGKIERFTGCSRNPMDNGYDLVCNKDTLTIVSQCYLWFC